ncbi:MULTISPECIES: head-tail joining protein [Rhizobium]|uniref:head-tail joining protein n=1 Tax=Rhizobium TaxID=379 RepID=UPI00041D52C5|nr:MULTISPECIES: hypothetical protein [Rhizobium]UFS81560.1 hypothetical protein LPB79_25140 [Rhizobium sp. T136]
MTARIFAPLPRIFLRTFAEPAPAVWARHREDGSTTSDNLQVIFNATSTIAETESAAMRTGVPVARCAIADALRLEPTRSGKPEEIFRVDSDQLVIGGRAYDVESCSSDGYGMLTIELKG